MKQKLLALLLALALSLSFTTVFAAEETDSAPPSEVETLTEEPVTEPETEKVDLKKQIVPESEVPDLIDYDIAVEEKYVCRAYWEETALNEVVFLKADGSLARYVFSFPVKYEADGEVYDKQPELVARETLLADTYRYELTAQNDTTLYCAENLSKGVFFQGEGMQVNLRPITKDEYDLLRGHIDMGAIVTPMGGLSLTTYDSVAVTGTAQSALATESKSTTAALYALSTTGQQASLAAVQDTLAVVPSYTGFQLQLDLAEGATSTTLYFELDPNGLILARPADTLLLYDKYGNTVGIVGDLLSDQGMAHDVAYTVTALDNGNYLLAATLPRTSGGNYTMSVTLDYDDLVDASIYSIDQVCYPESANLWVGYYPGSGYERVLIRPTSWSLTRTSQPNQVITSAQITIRDVTVTTPEEVIECREFTGNAWEETAACWNWVNGYSMGDLYDSNPVSSAIGWTEGYYYSFDITGLVQKWYTGESSWQKGVIFTWQNATATEMEKCFASTEYSNENYRPRLVVEYATMNVLPDGVYYMKSGAENYLSVETTGGLFSNLVLGSRKITEEPNVYRQLWRVKHVQNGYYTIRPYYYTPAAICNDFYSASLEEAGYSDVMEDLNSCCLWKIVVGSSNGYYLQMFGDYFCLIDSAYNSSSRIVSMGDVYGYAGDSWNFCAPDSVPRFINVYDSYSEELLFSSFAENASVPVRYMLKGDLCNIENMDLKISVCTDGVIDINTLPWSISNTSVVSFVDSSKNITALSEGSSQLSVLVNGISFPVFYIQVSQIELGKTCIENASSGKYVDINNQIAAPGVTVVQSDFHAGDTQIWDIELYNGGPYYTITSTASSTPVYYLGVQNDASSVDSPMVLRYGTVTDGMLWDISRSVRTGKYVLKPKNSNKVMSTFSSSSPTISLQTRTNDNVLRDEWAIYPVDYRITFNYYFDQAMQNHFGETLHDDVKGMQSFLAEYFLKYYRLVLPATYNNYTSIGDDGRQMNDTRDIRADLINKYGIGTVTSIRIAWTGANIPEKVSANADDGNYTIVIPEHTSSNAPLTDISRHNLDCLFHEFGHLLDLPDHYCYEKPSEGKSCDNKYCDIHKNYDPKFYDEDGNLVVRVCEMSSMSWNISSMSSEELDSLYCIECCSAIKNHLQQYCEVSE